MNLIIYSVLAVLQITFVHSYICPEPLPDIICDDAAKIKYYLYTKNNADYTEISTGKLTGVTINEGCPFIFIAHGFEDNGFQQWIKDMTAAFMQVGCFNVVAIDWSAIVSMYNYTDAVNQIYPYSAYRTCCSGEHVGDLILDINKSLGASLATMHFVGHSLGAHLGGCAGKYVTSKAGSSLARITGMDPAGPMFDGQPDTCRLSSDDAEFVDCIHTEILLIGSKMLLGHVDFYPNGGEAQPACLVSLSNPMPSPSCNHWFSFVLMIQSITTTGFISNACDNYLAYEGGQCTNTATSEMGYHVSKDARGKYFCDTTASPPYVMNGERRVKI